MAPPQPKSMGCSYLLECSNTPCTSKVFRDASMAAAEDSTFEREPILETLLLMFACCAVSRCVALCRAVLLPNVPRIGHTLPLRVLLLTALCGAGEQWMSRWGRGHLLTLGSLQSYSYCRVPLCEASLLADHRFTSDHQC